MASSKRKEGLLLHFTSRYVLASCLISSQDDDDDDEHDQQQQQQPQQHLPVTLVSTAFSLSSFSVLIPLVYVPHSSMILVAAVVLE